MPATERNLDNAGAQAARRALAMIRDLQAKVAALEGAARPAVAVAGMACRFPGGADDPEAYWRLLADGVDAITEVPAARWDVDAWYDPDPDRPGKMSSRWGGFLADIDQFDATHFAIARREAEALDPQHRLLLETSWHALEDAGIAPDSLFGRKVGVFVGLSTNDYGTLLGAGRGAEWIDAYASLGNAASAAAGRLAYSLGTQGPTLVVDTACSSSLVAVHLAIQSLRAGECELAVAAGVNLTLAPELTINFSKAHMLAADGRCKPFDARADGYVRAEGCGVVVLRRLGEVGGGRVRAVVSGSAVGQDGRSAGLTAPSGPAQVAVVRAALADAGLAAAAVDAIEAHGTGTALGDPIELHALAEVFAGRERPLWVGSVKSNIGHAEAAAGMAGLLKAVLMLERGAVPASLHFERLNPHIELGGVDIRVPTALEAVAPRAVGVSSFGFSGTNAHLVLTRAPAVEAGAAARPVSVLPLAARTETALEVLRQGYLARLGEGADWPSLAHTASLRQARLPWRLAVVAGDADTARAALAATAPMRAKGRPRLGFLVTGQGSAYAGMARGLLPGAPVLAEVLARCDAAMGLGRPLAELFEDGSALGRTGLAQPALFALAVGLGRQLRAWGIEPAALLGHSVGEYAAVVLAGVLPLEDGARLIARRAALMQALPAGGGMAALVGPRAAAEALLRRHRELEPAAWNTGSAMTVAGPLAALTRLEADPAVTGGELALHPLPVSHAFHSRLLEPMLDGLADAAAALPHAPPQVPVVGNLSGQVQPAWDGAYWRAHARAPVRFADGLRSLAGLGCELLVELGPQPVLAGFARSVLPGVPVLPTLARGREPWSVLLATRAELHRHGADPDWPAIDQPLNLPTTTAPNYPFERQRFWLDDPTLVREPTASPAPRAPDHVGDERVWGFYDQLAEIARAYQERPGEAIDGHLTFGLLDAPEPGFSWIRTLFDGPAAGARHTLLTSSQRAIKELAFAPVDLSALRRVMDFGCGHGADLITLAEKAPHLELHGFTISSRQVAVGRERAAARGLCERVHIHHGDSAKDAFPGSFDLIFGFEVAGLIEDKAALFANIGSHLAPGGVVVMADFVAVADRIAAVDTASFTPTAADWAELLSGRRLRITSCVDTSVEVANFLDDPGFAAEVDRLVERYGFSELTRRHLLSNHNIGQALRRGLMRYVILTAHHEPASRPETLQAVNESVLRNPSSRSSAPAGPALDAAWFYRAVWRHRPIEQVAESCRGKLDGLADAARALDAMARHFVRAADLTTATPAEPWRRLHAHLLRVEIDAPIAVPIPPSLPEAVLLNRCGPELRAVIEGRSDPLELLFPGGDQTDATSLYRDSPFTHAANAIAAEALSELLADFGPARVIEVGAGTGGTTQALLGRLRPGDQYLFTDVSPAFVAAGRRRFGLDGRTLDLERPLAEQGIEPHAYDVVVAANVLHATSDLVATLARVRELLRPGGALLLVENGAPMLWGDLTFGLTDGMWRFTDLGLRRGHALLPRSAWHQLLADAGFAVESFAAGTASTAPASGLLVFLARRAGARVIREAGREPIADATDVIDARALHVTSPDQVMALVGEVVELARTAAAMPTPPRLWLVTQRARAVLPGERTVPAQAALFGLANTLALEHPELRATVLDVDDPAAAHELIRQGTPETRLAVRRGQAHVLRLQPMTAPVAPISLRADATYVIVGGMGGVGRRVAEDLVAAGARHLVLAAPRLREMQVEGAHITTIQCDVTDEVDVRALMATLESRTPPTRGLFHVAGVLDDAVLAGQTSERIARVLAPKVTGADLLDRLSCGLPLDHFVLFSSSAAMLGSAAQANHAAANAFLDSLAEQRRADGLPGLSVAWGAWGEVGAAARVGEEVARRGLRPMPPAAAATALRRAMNQGQPTLGILDVDWSVFCARFGGSLPALFAEVRPRTDRVHAIEVKRPVAEATLADELATLRPADRFERLVLQVRATAARILGLDGAESVPAGAPLRELGLDSLMTVELRNALAALAATKLPATLVFDHPTCTELAQHLAAGPLAGLVAPPVHSEVLDTLADLDTAELAALLERELDAADQLLGETVP